jgi:hypothetical protein
VTTLLTLSYLAANYGLFLAVCRDPDPFPAWQVVASAALVLALGVPFFAAALLAERMGWGKE